MAPPPDVVPVDRYSAPDALVLLPLLDMILIAPDVPVADVPLTRKAEPPTAAAVVFPADSTKVPPLPLLVDPTAMLIAPVAL